MNVCHNISIKDQISKLINFLFQSILEATFITTTGSNFCLVIITHHLISTPNLIEPFFIWDYAFLLEFTTTQKNRIYRNVKFQVLSIYRISVSPLNNDGKYFIIYKYYPILYPFKIKLIVFYRAVNLIAKNVKIIQIPTRTIGTGLERFKYFRCR